MTLKASFHTVFQKSVNRFYCMAISLLDATSYDKFLYISPKTALSPEIRGMLGLSIFNPGLRAV